LNLSRKSVYFKRIITCLFFYIRLPYDARSAGARKRRSLNDTKPGDDRNNAVQPEMLTMYRALEVFLPTDKDLGPMGIIFISSVFSLSF